MIGIHGIVPVPAAVIAAAEPIKMLNYKTTTPAKFRKNTLTRDVAGAYMDEVASVIGIGRLNLDYVFFSAAQGAEPHVDMLDPAVFTSHTYVIPVILPQGRTVLIAEGEEADLEVGVIYEFNHERTHSMTVEDVEGGCVLIMIAIKH
jgi:hypothetical protein